MSLVNIANDWVFRKSWSSVLNFEIDKWVTDEARALLEYQIPKNAFGKSVRCRSNSPHGPMAVRSVTKI